MSPTFQLQEGTIADIHRAFDTGGLTRQELVKLFLNRIAAYEDGGPKLNSITTVNPRVLSDAAAIDAESRRQSGGPSAGSHGYRPKTVPCGTASPVKPCGH
jgi:amidase